jgi:hypothetical protein
MCNQGPAALNNGAVFTRIAPADVPGIVDALRATRRGVLPLFPAVKLGSGRFLNPPVPSSLRQPGPILFQPVTPGLSLRNALATTPDEVIADITASRLRGRGGAGFPTAAKWRSTRHSTGGPERDVICNADEALNRTVQKIAQDDLAGVEITERLVNHIEVGVRAYGPCLSCATPAIGQMSLLVLLEGPDGAEITRRACFTA